jgi:hypothetical protein
MPSTAHEALLLLLYGPLILRFESRALIGLRMSLSEVTGVPTKLGAGRRRSRGKGSECCKLLMFRGDRGSFESLDILEIGVE